MALTVDGWKLTVTLVDASIKNQSTLTYMMNPATVTDYITASAARAAVIAALQNVTGMAIKAHRLSEVTIEGGVLSPVAGTERENIAFVNVRIDGEPLKPASFKVPGALDGMFLAAAGPDRNVVDVQDADLITYAELWNTGAELVLSDGENTETGSTGGMLSGKRIHVANSNG